MESNLGHALMPLSVMPFMDKPPACRTSHARLPPWTPISQLALSACWSPKSQGGEAGAVQGREKSEFGFIVYCSTVNENVC